MRPAKKSPEQLIAEHEAAMAALNRKPVGKMRYARGWFRVVGGFGHGDNYRRSEVERMIENLISEKERQSKP